MSEEKIIQHSANALHVLQDKEKGITYFQPTIDYFTNVRQQFKTHQFNAAYLDSNSWALAVSWLPNLLTIPFFGTISSITRLICRKEKRKSETWPRK